MRVIAGTRKGRGLLSPRWSGLRPTSDRLRGTLFDILGPSIVGVQMLDGCAGTGAIGVEALSRGAAHVTFVERDPRAAALIRRNVELCEFADRCTIRCAEFARTARRLPKRFFDVVVLDPPYDASNIGEILTAAVVHVAPTGVLVLERARRAEVDTAPGLVSHRAVRAGDSVLEFFELATQG